MRMGVGSVGGDVDEAVARIAGLEALSWTHEARDAVDRCGAGQRRGQPGVQRQRIGHRPHAGVDGRRTVEGEHGGVVELHGARVHFFLSTPFSSAVLKPNLEGKESFIYYKLVCKIDIFLMFSFYIVLFP